jgi:hypothetical protein
MTTTFMADPLPEDRILFRARLSETVVALSWEIRPDAAAQVAMTTAAEAIRTRDAYAARDILASPAVTSLLGPRTRKGLARIADESGLGHGTMPSALANTLHQAVEEALTGQHIALSQVPQPSSLAAEPGRWP